jgi:hypothetical protein
MTTVLTELGPVEVTAGPGRDDELWLSAQDTEALTGWTMKPEGLCRDDVYMPVPVERTDDYVRDGLINLAAFWRRMNNPLAYSRNEDSWAFGVSAQARKASLNSLAAPDFSLPDLDGGVHSLSDYRGKKVFLATWASW